MAKGRVKVLRMDAFRHAPREEYEWYVPSFYVRDLLVDRACRPHQLGWAKSKAPLPDFCVGPAQIFFFCESFTVAHHRKAQADGLDLDKQLRLAPPEISLRRTDIVIAMASEYRIHKPSVLATLPRPLDHTEGRIVAREVYGQRDDQKKRKRTELAVGVDGETASIYDVSSLVHTNLSILMLIAGRSRHRD